MASETIHRSVSLMAAGLSRENAAGRRRWDDLWLSAPPPGVQLTVRRPGGGRVQEVDPVRTTRVTASPPAVPLLQQQIQTGFSPKPPRQRPSGAATTGLCRNLNVSKCSSGNRTFTAVHSTLGNNCTAFARQTKSTGSHWKLNH